MSFIHVNDLKIVDMLKREKRKFTMISTTLTIKIISDLGNYVYMPGDRILKKELYFLNKVKKHVNDNLENDFYYDRKDIDYYCFGNCKPGDIYNKCYEIDINSAYWYTAYKYGFISKEIFDEGNNKERISKKTRLAALGVLAKKTRQFDYDGNKFISHEPIKSRTEGVFFYCAAEVGNILKRLSIKVGDDFIFFWVDAIFVKSEESYMFLIHEFAEIGLYVKSKKLKYIKVGKETYDVRGYDDKKGEIDRRLFSVPSKDTSIELSKIISNFGK
jgi:hypothetical protein